VTRGREEWQPYECSEHGAPEGDPHSASPQARSVLRSGRVALQSHSRDENMPRHVSKPAASHLWESTPINLGSGEFGGVESGRSQSRRKAAASLSHWALVRRRTWGNGDAFQSAAIRRRSGSQFLP
jgi:hypothetical protein